MRSQIQLSPGGWVDAKVLGYTNKEVETWIICTPIDDPYGTVYTVHPDKFRTV